MRAVPCLTLALLLASPCLAETVEGRPGLVDGVTTWVLPVGPRGLVPTQSWHATGSLPGGDILVGGMDHRTNSALYRLRSAGGRLEPVGDARSASEAAGNWKAGETAQKFHTRPTWLDGRAWVATMDRSELDGGYLGLRGFHWYGYDPAAGTFSDPSAAAPGGVGADHVGVVTLAADPAAHVLYGAGVPTGHVYRLDPASGRSEDLGRPASYSRPYLYAGRFMWVGADGRLFLTSGNPRIGGSAPEDGNVHVYDPAKGFGEMRDWRLTDGRAIETGRCALDRSWCVMADDRGNLYRYEAKGPSFDRIGTVALERADSFLWAFQVTGDGRTAYAVETSYTAGSGATSLLEVDLAAGTTRRLCGLDELDPALVAANVHTGYDAFDGEGRFAFASFRGDGKGRVVLTRVDPAALKAALAARAVSR